MKGNEERKNERKRRNLKKWKYVERNLPVKEAALLETYHSSHSFTSSNLNHPHRLLISSDCNLSLSIFIIHLIFSKIVRLGFIYPMTKSGRNSIQAKLVLLGDMGTGKTSIVLRFVKGQYFDCQESTIGAAFFSQILSLNEATVKFDIWDTAGQERYHSLAPMYYRGAGAAIVVYDITSTESFARAKKWVQELQRQGNPYLVMALVANKADLETKRKVDVEEGMQYAQENGLFFMETSAKTALNINELFYEIAKKLVKARPSRPTGMSLHDGMYSGRRRLFCCSG